MSVQRAIVQDIKILLESALKDDTSRDSNLDGRWWWQVVQVRTVLILLRGRAYFYTFVCTNQINNIIRTVLLEWCEGQLFREVGDRIKKLQRQARKMHYGLDTVLSYTHTEV